MNDASHGGLDWRKSTFSGTGNCVQVAYADGTIFVRDSKRPSDAQLAFTNDEWIAFVAGAAAGEFSIDHLGA